MGVSKGTIRVACSSIRENLHRCFPNQTSQKCFPLAGLKVFFLSASLRSGQKALGKNQNKGSIRPRCRIQAIIVLRDSPGEAIRQTNVNIITRLAANSINVVHGGS